MKGNFSEECMIIKSYVREIRVKLICMFFKLIIVFYS